MRLGRSSQVQRAPQTRVVAPPAGSPLTTPATATAGVKALSDTHSPPDSPVQVRKKTEGTPQPLGSASRVDTLARDAFLEERDSSKSTEGPKPRLGSRSYPTSPRHSPPAIGNPTGPTGAPGSEEHDPCGHPVAAKMKAALSANLLKVAAFAGLAAASSTGQPTLSADPRRGRSVEALPVSDSSSIGALESGTSVSQAGDGTPMQFLRAAEGSASQSGFERLSLGEVAQPFSDTNMPSVDETYTDVGRSRSLQDARQMAQAGDGMPMQFLGAAEGSASQPGLDHHSLGVIAPAMSGSHKSLAEVCSDALEYYSRILPAIQEAQVARAEGRTVDPTVLVMLPTFTGCPCDAMHKAAIPLCVGAMAGCLALDCPTRKGIQRYGEQSSAIRYVPCAACHFWCVAARHLVPVPSETRRR